MFWINWVNLGPIIILVLSCIYVLVVLEREYKPYIEKPAEMDKEVEAKS